MKMKKQLCNYILSLMWGALSLIGLISTTRAFGDSYGVLWYFGFILALIWTLSKIK